MMAGSLLGVALFTSMIAKGEDQATLAPAVTIVSAKLLLDGKEANPADADAANAAVAKLLANELIPEIQREVEAKLAEGALDDVVTSTDIKVIKLDDSKIDEATAAKIIESLKTKGLDEATIQQIHDELLKTNVEEKAATPEAPSTTK